MRLLTILLTAGLACLAAVPKVTVEQVKAMSMFDLVQGVSDSEAIMLENAHDSVSGTVSVLIRIHEKRLPHLKSEDAWAQHLVDESLATPLNSIFLDRVFNTPEDRSSRLAHKAETLQAMTECETLLTQLKTLQAQLESQPKHPTTKPSQAAKTTPAKGPLGTPGNPIVIPKHPVTNS